MNSPRSTFWFSMLFYAVTLAIGVGAAWVRVMHPRTVSFLMPLDLTWSNAAVFVVVFALFTFALVRFVRTAHISLSFMLLVSILAGTQFVGSAFLPSPYDWVLAIGCVALLRLVPTVLSHNIAIMFGIGGIAAVLGLSVNPMVACAILAVLSIYDIISVYRTGHMVALAGRMLETGAVFGFLVPQRAATLFMRRDEALRTRNVMMLGSGDIGLPLMLAASAVTTSLGASLVVSVAALGGLAFMHWMFAHQKHPAPMAALPPIALASILGYVLASLLNI